MPLTLDCVCRAGLLVASLCLAQLALADEVRDLEEDLALSIEDARPSRAGDKQLNTSFRYQRMRETPGAGQDELQFTPRLQFGVTDDFQVAVATPYRFGDSANSSQGEARLEGMLRLNREHDGIPSFAIDAGVEQPYGANKGGTEILAKGIMTKSLGQSKGPDKVAQLHVNVSARHNFNPLPDERTDRFLAGLALSRQLNEHWLLAGSLFSEQQRQRGDVINMAELGVRWKLSEQWVLSGALGHGFSGPVRERLTFGVQRSLD